VESISISISISIALMKKPPQDLTKVEMGIAMAKWALSHLIFFRYASSSCLEDNLLAARRTITVMYSLSLAVIGVALLSDFTCSVICLVFWSSSLIYLVRIYKKCARILREDEVRQIMES